MPPRRALRPPAPRPLSAAFARHDTGWHHGQVVQIYRQAVVLQLHDGEQVRCRPGAIRGTDPVISLLLSPALLGSDLDENDVLAAHSTILERLLGDSRNPHLRPTRDIALLLDGIVAAEDIPDPLRDCVWQADDGRTYHFPLQHAVDFVVVHDSSARRIAKAVRESVGAHFYAPPPPRATLHGRHPAAIQITRERSAPDSFFESDSDDSDAGNQTTQPQAAHRDRDGERHARIVAALVEYPDVLDMYLATQPGRRGTSTKRPRSISVDEETDDRPHKKPKSQFQPPTEHRRVHKLITAPAHAGTSAHAFVDDMLDHPAVEFAPHPGVLTRLYDFKFGVRGLSIMHLGRLDPIAKMTWVMSLKDNMQDLSSTVGLPDASAAQSVDDILSALASLRGYCLEFCTSDMVDLVQVMHVFVQRMVGLSMWDAEDLKFLVYWLNSILQAYRTCAQQDARYGTTTRLLVKDTIVSSNPNLQAITQLITARKVEQLMLTSRRSAPNPRGERLNYGGAGGTSIEGGRRSRPQDDHPPVERAAGVPPEIQALVPRQGGRSLCLRWISVQGCTGPQGSPDQCQYFRSRAHFVPTERLPNLLREFIAHRFGGLRRDLQHL